MAAHKFKVGQSVLLRKNRTTSGLSAMRCKIVRHLPPQIDGENQYRVQGGAEGFERVVKESDLSIEGQ